MTVFRSVPSDPASLFLETERTCELREQASAPAEQRNMASRMASLFRGGHKAMSQRNGYGLDQPAGVGIVFKSGPDEALFVKVCEGLCACCWERECCLLVLDSVTSTPQWIRQPEAAWFRQC